jgi:cell division protein FtsB
VFDEMRKCNETRNYAYLLSLIEEAQSMANRMEAALGNVKDIKKLSETRSELKAEVKKLEEKVVKLGGKKKRRVYSDE